MAISSRYIKNMEIKKIVAISIAVVAVLAIVFYVWYRFNTKPTTENFFGQTTLTSETLGWNSFQNERYGINFKHPSDLNFTGSQIAIIGKMLYAISAKDEYDNGYYFIILNKAAAEKDIDQEIAVGKNEHVEKEMKSPAGKITMNDGLNADNKYFVQGFLKGSENIYQFKLIAPSYSQETLNLFKKIIATVEISK